MKVRGLVLAGMVAIASLVGAAGLVNGEVMAKVPCPAGSIRGKGTEVSTLADCNIPADSDKDLMGTMTTIINVVVGCVGIIAVAVIVLGGISFATSQGDAAKVAKAKNTILYGVVGLVIALLAFAIVNFVLTGVFG